MYERSHVWRRAGELALVLAGSAPGCDGAGSPVHVVDVEDGTYLRGAQLSKLEIAPGYEVTRTELYLDGRRVAADEFAPFELAWDTRDFKDGAHKLLARIYLADASHRDSEAAMWIDNTAPQLGTIPATALRGTGFAIPATDNLKLARVEISRGVAGEAPLVATAEPFTFSWPWACGTTAIHVRAIDAAGGEVTADASVLGADPDDRDCDGFRAQSQGGDDCDDDNVSAHPGAVEVPEGYDLDCDGRVASLPGIDFDGDGVPSIADGGNDCNDSDPAVHGPAFHFKHVPITQDGVPVTWNAGEAVLSGYSSDWGLYLNRGGVIEQYRVGREDGVVHRTQLAADANPASISASYIDRLAFGRGNEIKILAREGGQPDWIPRATITAAGPVGKLLIARYPSEDYLAFQVGTQLWFGVSSGSSWTTELVADVGAPVQEIVGCYRNGEYTHVAIRSNDVITQYSRDVAGAPFASSSVTLVPSAAVSYRLPDNHFAQISVAVKDEENGSVLYNLASSAPLLRTSRRIATLTAIGEGSLLVTYGDQAPPQVVIVHESGTRARVVQDVSGMADLDLEPWRAVSDSVFLGQGEVHLLAGTVPAAADPAHDGVDRDCDKHD